MMTIQYHIYADDVQLFLSIDPTRPGDAACALWKLSQCVMELQSWMTCNKLMMNPEKTEFFIACSPTHHLRHLHDLTFRFGNLDIPAAPTVKNLGVVFDRNMGMADHVTQLCRSLNFQIRNLNRIRRFLDHNTCHNAIRALILAKLDYCCSLLNGVSQKHISRLQRLQNRCARLVLKKPKLTPSASLLKDLHWLPVSQRIQYRTLIHTYKCLNNLSPGYLTSLLCDRVLSSYSLRSSLGRCLHIPRSRVKAGDRAFSVTAPRLWNKLPVMVRNVNSISSFKKVLKTHLFS